MIKNVNIYYEFSIHRYLYFSQIVDPSGLIAAQCSEGSNVAIAAINKNLLEKTRLSMPLISQKRFDLYPKVGELIPRDNVDQYQFGQVTINAKTVFYKTGLTLAIVNKRCVVPGRILHLITLLVL